MNYYVAGFLFYGDDDILLVRKTKPSWQMGLLNAIGGKLEGDESFDDCMRREFLEETKLDIPSWKFFCEERGSDYTVRFFKAKVSFEEARPVVERCNDAGEVLFWSRISSGVIQSSLVVGNLRWLVPLALDWRNLDPVYIKATDDIKTRPVW